MSNKENKATSQEVQDEGGNIQELIEMVDDGVLTLDESVNIYAGHATNFGRTPSPYGWPDGQPAEAKK